MKRLRNFVISPILALALAGCATAADEFNFNVPTITGDSGPVVFGRVAIEQSLAAKAGVQLGQIVFPVRFGDDHEELCILDTGAASSSVNATDYFKQLPSAGRAWVAGVSGSWQAAFRVRAKRTSIGQRVYEDQLFTLLDADQAMIPKINCLVGMNFFVGSTLHFDFKHQRFEMLREIPAGIPNQPLVLTRAGAIEVPIKLGHKEMLAVWDSGNVITAIDRREIEADAAQFRAYRVVTNGGADALGRSFDTKLYRASDVEFAGSHLDEAVVQELDLRIATNMQPRILLGLDLIGQHEWYFDLVQRRWAVK